ncbi:MAG: DUF4340 domain-containing protein [Halioglobus sp.]|nr:DUF4340 domain-containing protein [Halioglobus sp.]
MNRIVTALLVVLLIQCGITAVVFWPQPKLAQITAAPALATFNSNAVDEIRIGDKYDNQAILVKSSGRWLLPAMENLPADAAKVDALLEGIINQPADWPIGVSAAARQRFQVVDYHFQKRLSFFSDGSELGSIFLGSSPGFRKVHARNQSQDAIYGITFNAFDAPSFDDAWLDPRLLQLRSLLRIDADLYSVSFENGTWLSGIGRTPDQQELEALVGAFRSLMIEGVADQGMQRDLSVTEADLRFTIESLAGTVTLELFSTEDQHFIHSSEFAQFFKISTYDFEQLAGIDFRLISGEDSMR